MAFPLKPTTYPQKSRSRSGKTLRLLVKRDVGGCPVCAQLAFGLLCVVTMVVGQASGQSSNARRAQVPITPVFDATSTFATHQSFGDVHNGSGFQASSVAPSSVEADREQIIRQSLNSDRDQRVAAIESMRQLIPDQRLQQRIMDMAAHDEDMVVRGYARMLSSEWNLDINGNPSTSFTLSDAQVIPASGVIGDSHVVTPPMDRLSDGSFGLFEPQTPFWINSGAKSLGTPADAARSTIQTVSDQPLTEQQLSEQRQPRILGRPFDASPDQTDFPFSVVSDTLLAQDMEAPLGFTGPSGVARTEFQQNDHFVPIDDRWRIGFPAWDRYGRGQPYGDDYPFEEGWWLDPYNQNVLKGDYPIIGQHTFLNVTGISLMLHQYRQVPTATTPFESTVNPFSEPFFGDPNQYFYTHYFRVAIDLFHGNEAFKPFDWRLRIEPVFNVNHLSVGEFAVVNPDVRRGLQRTRADFALEEWFIEAKLADLSPDYDFMSIRAGSQFFVSDFRGFLFRDTNRAVRLFGTRFANRDQFNLVWFDQAEKDTNSLLNTFKDRHQNTVIANYFRQDFVFPGYTVLASFHYNHDKPSFHFDDNDFLVRPDPAGVFREHQIDSYYLGLGSDGHIGRMNISSQMYLALGHDTHNPIANEEQDIFAQMAALELSYDRDWIRFRGSYFFASGDNDPNDTHAGGFDTIFDDPIFAGGEFSYWQRQAIRLFGVNLVQEKSLVPDLRSSKIEGQTNFVNPGLQLVNLGMDFEVTPKLRTIFNTNYLWFDTTQVLEAFTFQGDIARDIGVDISVGVEYRPLLNDNVIFVLGSAVLIPARGLRDLYGTEIPDSLKASLIENGFPVDNDIPDFQSHFVEVVLMY